MTTFLTRVDSARLYCGTVPGRAAYFLVNAGVGRSASELPRWLTLAGSRTLYVHTDTRPLTGYCERGVRSVLRTVLRNGSEYGQMLKDNALQAYRDPEKQFVIIVLTVSADLDDRWHRRPAVQEPILADFMVAFQQGYLSPGSVVHRLALPFGLLAIGGAIGGAIGKGILDQRNKNAKYARYDAAFANTQKSPEQKQIFGDALKREREDWKVRQSKQIIEDMHTIQTWATMHTCDRVLRRIEFILKHPRILQIKHFQSIEPHIQRMINETTVGIPQWKVRDAREKLSGIRWRNIYEESAYKEGVKTAIVGIEDILRKGTSPEYRTQSDYAIAYLMLHAIILTGVKTSKMGTFAETVIRYNSDLQRRLHYKHDRELLLQNTKDLLKYVPDHTRMAEQLLAMNMVVLLDKHILPTDVTQSKCKTIEYRTSICEQKQQVLQAERKWERLFLNGEDSKWILGLLIEEMTRVANSWFTYTTTLWNTLREFKKTTGEQILKTYCHTHLGDSTAWWKEPRVVVAIAKQLLHKYENTSSDKLKETWNTIINRNQPWSDLLQRIDGEIADLEKEIVCTEQSVRDAKDAQEDARNIATYLLKYKKSASQDVSINTADLNALIEKLSNYTCSNKEVSTKIEDILKVLRTPLHEEQMLIRETPSGVAPTKSMNLPEQPLVSDNEEKLWRAAEDMVKQATRLQVVNGTNSKRKALAKIWGEIAIKGMSLTDLRLQSTESNDIAQSNIERWRKSWVIAEMIAGDDGLQYLHSDPHVQQLMGVVTNPIQSISGCYEDRRTIHETGDRLKELVKNLRLDNRNTASHSLATRIDVANFITNTLDRDDKERDEDKWEGDEGDEGESADEWEGDEAESEDERHYSNDL